MKKYLLLAGLFSLASNSVAASYNVTQVTNNNYYDDYAKLNKRGDAVWSSWVNPADTGWTLFEYSAQTKATTQISSANVFVDSHRINNVGDVVWMAHDGHDQEIYLYHAATMTTMALTNNDTEDTYPEISDNGDVSWLEQTGTTASEARLFRYDAITMTSAEVVYVGATRQGYQTMNARGDIAWNAFLADTQHILLYTAATGAITQLSNYDGAIHSNQRIIDNGDVIWNTYDYLTSLQGIMYYKAADQSSTQIVADAGEHLFGSNGNIVWVSSNNGVYSINTYDPVTNITKVIASEASNYAPNLAGISALGDVAWSVITGTSWISRVYNTKINNSVDLTNTQGFGTFELKLADNGDVVWSLWDGSDYEVSSYQADSGSITQLTNNQIDDGITSINSNGTIVWLRHDVSDSELMMAVRNLTSLEIQVKKLEIDSRGSRVTLNTGFSFSGMPSAADIIGISINETAIISLPFSKFTSKGKGVYTYKTRDSEVDINFTTGSLKARKGNIQVVGAGTHSTVKVTLSFGQASAMADFVLR